MVAAPTTVDANGELAITDAGLLANQPTGRSEAEDPNAYVFLAITGLRTVVRSPEPLGVSA
jgi:hypothetical protein